MEEDEGALERGKESKHSRIPLSGGKGLKLGFVWCTGRRRNTRLKSGVESGADGRALRGREEVELMLDSDEEDLGNEENPVQGFVVVEEKIDVLLFFKLVLALREEEWNLTDARPLAEGCSGGRGGLEGFVIEGETVVTVVCAVAATATRRRRWRRHPTESPKQ